MKYIDVSDNLYKITETYPETIDFFVKKGFAQMQQPQMRKTFGSSITLEMALKLKQIEVKSFVEALEDLIEFTRNNQDTTLVERVFDPQAEVTIQGVLPCPVRMPLLEGWEQWLKENEATLGYSLSYKLQAASMGLSWLIDDLKNADKPDCFSDLFISAGFELFFDKDLMGKFKSQGVFEDLTGMHEYNEDFNHAGISLKDPKGQYAMLGLVPAIFLVNEEELKGKPMPKTWGDLLTEDYWGKVSLPIGDFDLFNAILLNIYKGYGEAGIQALGKSLFRGMHPSEMVKSHYHVEKPVVTIMPYFFTKMVQANSPLKPVWPEDGAIISPIFMLCKKEKKDQLAPIVSFFASKAVGEILAHQGRFPSVHPEVDNQGAKGKSYQWLGWDFIEQNDIGDLIQKTQALFDQASGKK